MKTLCSSHFEMHLISSLAWEGFVAMQFVYSLTRGWVSSTQVEVHFVFSLAWDGFVQLKLRYIFISSLARHGFVQHKLKHCSHWYGRGLVNTC
jgi:hypothetical protein